MAEHLRMFVLFFNLFFLCFTLGIGVLQKRNFDHQWAREELDDALNLVVPCNRTLYLKIMLLQATKRIAQLENDKGALVERNEVLSLELGKYRSAMFTRIRIEMIEKRLGKGYNTDAYIEFMTQKYNSTGTVTGTLQEISVLSYHHRVFQYIIHMANEITDRRIGTLRKEYGNANDRQKCHYFCPHMQTMYSVLSQDIQDKLIYLGAGFTVHEIVAGLKALYVNKS